MTSPTTIGRKPITVVELVQPNKAGTGTIKWRFMDGRGGVFDFGDYSDPDDLQCDPLPCLVSVSTSSNEINVGSNMEGRSPFGVTGKVTVSLRDFPWNDGFGDWVPVDVPAGTAPPVLANYWALWTARHELFNDMYLRIFDGYEGQELADMTQRLYVLDNVSGPDGDGNTTLTGLDPLRLAGDKKAEFPRTSSLDLYGDIDDSTTDIVMFGTEADLSDDFGNTGAIKYIGLGTEIIRYTGYSGDGLGRFTLSGVDRGALDTTVASHKDQDKAQRIGRYESISFWHVLHDLLANHTEMPEFFIPLDDWDSEGGTYLPTYKATRTIVKPTEVGTLAGQLTQQGLFYIWWAEDEQLVKMLAIRAPDEAPKVMTDESHLMRGSVLKREPSMRLSKVAVYYDVIDSFGSNKGENFRKRFTAVNGENEGETRAVSIYAPWVTNRTQAVQLAIRLLIRYMNTPRFLTVTIDAKDRDATVGSVLDVETRSIIDPDTGAVRSKRWQVVSAKALKSGHSYILNLQTYEYIGNFGRFMADGAPDYAGATDAEKKKGAWYAGADGLMPDGTEGYLYQ